MPCTALHLAIVEEYVLKNKEAKKDVFVEGAILPDLAEDKNASHYCINKKIKSIKDMVDTKVDIVKCSKEFDFSDELKKAVYLHLLTDYLFYQYIYNPETEKENPKDVLVALDSDQGIITEYVFGRYSINSPDGAEDLLKIKQNTGKLRFLSEKEIERFIKVVSNFNLNDVKQNIVQNAELFLQEFMEEMNQKSDDVLVKK